MQREGMSMPSGDKASPQARPGRHTMDSRMVGRVMIGVGTVIGACATMGLMTQPSLLVVEIPMAIVASLMVKVGWRTLRREQQGFGEQ